jgi:hypothetical protein
MINELFHSYGYESKRIDGGSLFFLKNSNKKVAFWLIIQEAYLDSILQNQAELFNACKKVCHDDDFDKNVSMLLLWDTGGKLNLNEMKQKIIKIEEDPYFFKKYVLYYSQIEYENLISQTGAGSFIDYLKTQIVRPETFAYYKQNSVNQNWQSLLYRIVIKVPFIDIDIKVSKGLASLSENNKRELQKANLLDLNNKLCDILNATQINDIEPIDLLKKLMPAFGEKPNGN